MPISFRDSSSRRSTLRARRIRFRVIGALAGITFLATAAYGANIASYLPQFSVQDIHITGAREVRTDLLRAYIETQLNDGRYAFLSRSNIFLYPKEGIESAIIEYFPRIRSAKVSRESLLATAITVSVEEREAFAKWCSSTALGTSRGDECYFLGESGFVFAPETSSAPAVSPYIFRGNLASTTPPLGQQYLPGKFAGVLALLERLGQAGFSPVEVVAEDEQDFSVRLRQGFEIRASFGADLGALVKNLELILASEPLRGAEDELEYIDLRFGNRVYYKLKGAQQEAIDPQ